MGTLINDDVFNRHIYQDEVMNTKANLLCVDEIIVIQKRAYQIKNITILGSKIKLDFKQGVSLECYGESTQQKFVL